MLPVSVNILFCIVAVSVGFVLRKSVDKNKDDYF